MRAHSSKTSGVDKGTYLTTTVYTKSFFEKIVAMRVRRDMLEYTKAEKHTKVMYHFKQLEHITLF